ncbi:hypothetical protein CUMW_080030 [Citrus unshiu]|uniref:Uncharacterized protein n=1 Tax=Citrus unshiu TaxID=55188 RepID=A0A2H5NVM1_CITUN|nr:hypothetical protein CUMW_080030 [Citrus unshiu]
MMCSIFILSMDIIYACKIENIASKWALAQPLGVGSHSFISFQAFELRFRNSLHCSSSVGSMLFYVTLNA